MDRNREARRGSMAATNGLSRRRQRSSNLRDSPEEDGAIEFQETARLRDRGSKKDRDRSSRNKRRRGDRLMHGSNREEGGESTEESVDDDEEDDDEDGGAVRMLPPNPASSSSISNHHHRRSFPPAKVVKTAPAWKVADEMIGVSVPRKARSVSVKRSPECWISGGGGGGGEQIHRQASTSPARPGVALPSPAPISPSSSNVSVRKKMKPVGPKHLPPKISKQSEIEIEVAEVLYGLMRQTQCPSKQEIFASASQKLDSKDVNGSSNDAKSRVSSPISISHSAAPHSPLLPQISSSSTTPLPAVAPKRKKPPPVKYEDENPAILAVRNGSNSSATKYESEQPAKMEISLPNFEKTTGSAVENGGASINMGSYQAAPLSSEPQSKSIKPESNAVLDSKPFTKESESRDGFPTKEEAPSPKKESPSCARLDVDLENATTTKTISTAAEVERKREEIFKIDLMASPPLRSSPERDGVINFVSDPNAMAPDVEMVQNIETTGKDEEKVEKICKKDAGEVRLEEKKIEAIVEEGESHKPIVSKERILDLQLDLEKHDRNSGTASVSGSKLQQHVQKQQTKATRNDPKAEKTAQSVSLPSPMVASWPGGLPHLGYMPPLQTVVSMDGSTVSSTAVQPPHFLLSQPRPKRCASHYYIARNIHYHQQFTRMNSFWPSAAGSASLYGAKPYKFNGQSTETTPLGNPLQGGFPGINSNFVQDKGQAVANYSGNTGKDKSSVAANIMDAAQRKPHVLQQAPQPAAAGNLLHGPAFIFPVSQQQSAAAAAAALSGSVKSSITTGNAASSIAVNPTHGAPGSSSSTAAGAMTINFNYPNLPANEAQHLAILQNNGYPFSIPAHVGVPPAYRGGTHAQAIPFFNGPFYSSQMLHPSQLQQQQPPQSQPQQFQQGHQNTSTSSGSSSSQKHQQTQQQRLQGSDSNGGGGSSHSFPASKSRPQQQQQQQQNQYIPAPHHARQLESEMGGEESPSTADSRISHAHKSVFGPKLIPIHPQNLALMTPSALGGGGGGGGNHGEKQPQQGLKGGVEFIPSQAFAMSFASFNAAATAPGLDFSSMPQNHGIFHSLPEAARHGYQIATAAAAPQSAQQKKSHQTSEEGKTGGDSISADDERKVMARKAPPSVGQTLAFSRPDSINVSGSTILGHTVIDSSTRTPNLISAPVTGNRASRSITSTASANPPNSQQQQQQQQQHQQQQLFHLQMQQQMQQQQQQQQLAVAAAARSKSSAASNANVYSDRVLSSSSLATNFPNAVPVFPQTLIQNNSPAQSPQWKNSARSPASPVPSPSLISTTTSSLKNLPHHQGRTQQGRTQISFGVNTRSPTAQGQQHPSNNQSPSPSMVVGSPTTSSISKSAGGSPRTTSTGSKTGQAQAHSPSGPSRKSSPVGGRNVPSILSNSLSSATKAQLQQQQAHKQALQQAQIFFSNAAYMQGQFPQSSSTTTTNSTTTGYYHHQRRQSEQQQQGSASSNGMLPLYPPSLTSAGASTSDHSKAAGYPHQLMSAAFPYIHAVPATVQVKPAEHKQPARE